MTNCVLFAFGSEQMAHWFPSLFAQVALGKAGYTKAGARRAKEPASLWRPDETGDDSRGEEQPPHGITRRPASGWLSRVGA